eukprot:1103661-Alexandrium_andersonii.AAC.1
MIRRITDCRIVDCCSHCVFPGGSARRLGSPVKHLLPGFEDLARPKALAPTRSQAPIASSKAPWRVFFVCGGA